MSTQTSTGGSGPAGKRPEAHDQMFLSTLPETQYARAGDVQIAYQVHGEGALDAVWVGGPGAHLELMWENPSANRLLEHLGRFARVVRFDRRGTGLSDPVTGAPTLEQQADDLAAAMDAAGFERAALIGEGDGARLCILFAATRPERVSALALYGATAQGSAVLTEDLRDQLLEIIEERWGEGDLLRLWAPSRADDPAFRHWWRRFERAAASPHTARQLLAMATETDIGHLLPGIHVPTLVLHRRDDTLVSPELGRQLSGKIPEATFVELSGTDHLSIAGDVDEYIDEVEEFLTGERQRREPDRVLATVLFTDIVGSTHRAAELGDRRWRELLATHDEVVRRELARHGGEEVKTMGDGFLIRFELPPAAIRSAQAIRAALADLGLTVRAGVHTGVCELIGDDVGGLAVHIAARLAALGDAGEVLVSGTVKDIVIGSGIELADHGHHSLRGVPGEWRVFSA
jgi:class 3 adenylate cyclase